MQTNNGIELLKTFGAAVYMDATHGTNREKKQLYTLVVMADDGHIVPCASIVVDEDKKKHLRAGLRALVEMVGDGWSPRIIMVDDDVKGVWISVILVQSLWLFGCSFSEYKVSKEVFGEAVQVRVCYFHVSRNLKAAVTDYLRFESVRLPNKRKPAGTRFILRSLCCVLAGLWIAEALTKSAATAAFERLEASRQAEIVKSATKTAEEVAAVIERMTRLRPGESEELFEGVEEVFKLFGCPKPVEDTQLTASHVISELKSS